MAGSSKEEMYRDFYDTTNDEAYSESGRGISILWVVALLVGLGVVALLKKAKGR